MSSGHVPHRVEHTRNKHSRAVYRGNEIVIRLARNLSETQAQEHTQSLLDRMIRLVVRELEKTPIDPFKRLLQGEQMVLTQTTLGTTYMFTLVAGSKLKATRSGNAWKVEIGPKTRKQQLHRFLWKILSESEQDAMAALVRSINAETFGYNLSDVRLECTVSQWGSCRRGSISLSSTLLFVPEHLRRYVIIHELVHCKVANHSEAFWREVERFVPEYRECRNALTGYRVASL